jgi:hypothetical protein
MASMHVSIRILAMLLVFSGCNGDDSVISAHPSRFNQRSSGEVSIGRPGAIVLSNPYGAIIVDAQRLDSTSTWFLDKWLQATSDESALTPLSMVHVQSGVVDDTLFLSVTAPRGTTGLEVLLSATVPFNIPCVVASYRSSTCRLSIRSKQVQSTVSGRLHHNKWPGISPGPFFVYAQHDVYLGGESPPES